MPKTESNYTTASDGYIARVAAEYTSDKHQYLEEYIKIFTNAVYKSWNGNLVYIDLFSCCGKYVNTTTKDEQDGSPLIALRYPFKYYFFNDTDSEKIKALKHRISSRFPNKNVQCVFSNYDANECIQKLCEDYPYLTTPRQPLCLIFSDPNNLNPHFNTIKYISDTLKADILFHLSTGMHLRRNIKNAMKRNNSEIDDFIGSQEWRNYPDIKFIIKLYFTKLRSLGYIFNDSGFPPNKQIKNSRNATLYNLFLLTKHKLGEHFSKISLNYSSSQGDLFYG